MLSRVLEALGKENGLAAYGFSDVENAANSGAVDSLIVCDDLFIGNRNRVENIMQSVKNARGEVHILNHAGDAGKQLASLGGIAATLRYKIG
jgi:protein pelota